MLSTATIEASGRTASDGTLFLSHSSPSTLTLSNPVTHWACSTLRQAVGMEELGSVNTLY